jgi:hypothetical protein
MAGVGIRADIAGYGRRVPRYGRSAGTPGMGLAVTASIQRTEDDDDFS